MKPPKNPEQSGHVRPSSSVFPDHVALGRKNGSSKYSLFVLILATPFVLLAVFGVWLKEKVVGLNR